MPAHIVGNSTACALPLTDVTRELPSEDDIDECEFFIGELIAEHFGMDVAETLCVIAGRSCPWCNGLHRIFKMIWRLQYSAFSHRSFVYSLWLAANPASFSIVFILRAVPFAAAGIRSLERPMSWP